MQARRQYKHIFKVLKEKMMNPEKVPLKKEVIDFFRHTRAARNNPQQSHTTRNAKGSPSGRRNMTPDKNMNLNKGMRITGNGDCRGKFKFIII